MTENAQLTLCPAWTASIVHAVTGVDRGESGGTSSSVPAAWRPRHGTSMRVEVDSPQAAASPIDEGLARVAEEFGATHGRRPGP